MRPKGTGNLKYGACVQSAVMSGSSGEFYIEAPLMLSNSTMRIQIRFFALTAESIQNSASSGCRRRHWRLSHATGEGRSQQGEADTVRFDNATSHRLSEGIAQTGRSTLESGETTLQNSGRIRFLGLGRDLFLYHTVRQEPRLSERAERIAKQARQLRNSI